jgi:OOP family OmpA-OmpF porin
MILSEKKQNKRTEFRRLLAGACLLVPFFLTPLVAGEPSPWQMGLSVGQYQFDPSQFIKGGGTIDLRVGYLLQQNAAVEIGILRPSAKSSINGNPADALLGHLDWVYLFRPESRWVPFVKVGTGLFQLEDAGISLVGQVGIGLKYALTERIALRTEVTNFVAFGSDYDGSVINNLAPTIGLEYRWQKRTRPPEPPKPADEHPPPIAPVRPTRKRPVRSVPTPTAPDKIKTITLEVEFNSDRATPLDTSDEKVKEFAKIMKKYPKAKLVLKGYADSVGEEAYNMLLSQRRADQVKKTLVNLGIEPRRISAKGLGSGKEDQKKSPKKPIGRFVIGTLPISGKP